MSVCKKLDLRSSLIKVKAPAKINLTLEVLNKREDGFHNIQSVMQAISLYDFITVEVADDEKAGIEISGSSAQIPYNESNIAYQACRLFLEAANAPGCRVKIFIEKHIPVCAGLAGGSADAAGVLYALNILFDNKFNSSQLHSLCAKIGSDVNFCLTGGTALCTSRGEILTQLPSPTSSVSLVKPKKLAISAKEAYARFSKTIDKSIPNATGQLVSLLEKNNFENPLLYNSLEKPLLSVYEELSYLKNARKNLMMSGSGPTFYLLRDNFERVFDPEKFEVIENLKFVDTGVEKI